MYIFYFGVFFACASWLARAILRIRHVAANNVQRPMPASFNILFRSRTLSLLGCPIFHNNTLGPAPATGMFVHWTWTGRQAHQRYMNNKDDSADYENTAVNGAACS